MPQYRGEIMYKFLTEYATLPKEGDPIITIHRGSTVEATSPKEAQKIADNMSPRLTVIAYIRNDEIIELMPEDFE